MLLLTLALALAQEPAPELPDSSPPAAERGRWGGIGIPYASANSTDGFGLGLGGEVFRRPPGEDEGYDLKFSVSTYFALSGKYHSHFAQMELYRRHDVLVQLGYSRWSNLVYAGSGGEDVARLNPPEAESGNLLSAPFAMVFVAAPVGKWKVYGQGFTRFGNADARPGGLLDADRPYGARGGAFGQAAVGVFRQRIDRWPLPREGWMLDASLFANLAGERGGDLAPSGGYFAEGSGWLAAGSHLSFGARAHFTNTFGTQPFFVQELLPGRLKDELGYEQPLTGYGRTRSRGDGLWAVAVEARPYAGRVRKGFIDIALYGSVFVEEAFLFAGTDPGPHMPTVGTGFDLVWQGATVVRPYAAWGWRTEPGRKRHAVPQFGLALKSPL